MANSVTRDVRVLGAVIHSRTIKRPRLRFSIVANGIMLSASMLVAFQATSCSASASAVSLDSPVATGVRHSAIASEKESIDLVNAAVAALRGSWSITQLQDLASSLMALSDWIDNAQTLSDSLCIKDCIDHAESTLGYKDVKGQEIEKAHTSAVVAVATARASYNAVAGVQSIVDTPVPTSALPDSLDNFQKLRTYQNFTDVRQDVWQYEYVKSANEYGLMDGVSGTEFNLDGEVTIEQAVVMAARLRSIFETGSKDIFAPNTAPVAGASEWAHILINYAIEKGIIKSGEFTNYNTPATRAQMAHIFASALPADSGAYKELNTIVDGAIPDVDSSTPYWQDIYTLYRAGILTGDGNHAYAPNSTIKRGETAAIVARLPIVDSHKPFSIPTGGTSTPSPTVSYLGDGVTVAPWQGHLIYVGKANNLLSGQPRSTVYSARTPNAIQTQFGYHGYNCEQQWELDEVMARGREAYQTVMAQGDKGLGLGFGLSDEDWDNTVGKILADKPYDVDVWHNYISTYFPNIAESISSDKVQAQTLKLYCQYLELYGELQTGETVGVGETGGVTAYDVLFRNKSSCVASSQLQMLAADLMGLDIHSFGGNNHMSTRLQINGVWFVGETAVPGTIILTAIPEGYKLVTERTSATSMN